VVDSRPLSLFPRLAYQHGRAACAALLALLFHGAFMRMVRRLIGPQHVFVQSLISRIFGASRFPLVLTAIALVLPIVPLSGATAIVIAEALAVCFVLLIGWAAITAIELAGDFYVRRFRIDVVPLSYFLQTPFQNWTRNSAELIGTVLFWLDYTVPVDRLREKLSEIVKESKLWDRRVVNLQVTDASDRSIQLRALASACNSQDVWDLRCEIREKLIGFLQEHYPGALPKQRAGLRGLDGGAQDVSGFAPPRDANSAPAERRTHG
jgi:hypothetical protein